MYKVFINDKPIILTDSLDKNDDYLQFSYENIVLDEILYKLKYESLKGIVLICKDLQNNWTQFQSNFKKVVAAGGLVINEKNEFLFIYRGKKWDLPKGRIEHGENIEETAIREVQEECGLKSVELKDYLITTYHLFYQNHKQKLKETHWYLMKTSSKETLAPQIEEGITKVEFKNQTDTKDALENTYANIHLVFESYDAKA